jgi:hypothetical protein
MNTIDRDELFIDSRDEYRYSSSSISIDDDDDDDDDVRSASTTETNGILKRIEKFVNNCQDNYTIKVRPDYRIKFKHEYVYFPLMMHISILSLFLCAYCVNDQN